MGGEKTLTRGKKWEVRTEKIGYEDNGTRKKIEHVELKWKNGVVVKGKRAKTKREAVKLNI